MKFNEYDSVVISGGYDQSMRAWDCRSHSTEPIQASFLFFYLNPLSPGKLYFYYCYYYYLKGKVCG